MKLRILGCGPSYGVPSLVRGYGLCDPQNEKNTRTRTSMMLMTEQGNIVFDTGPEIREQLIQAGRPDIAAIVYTHSHYDHIGGAEDLRKGFADVKDHLDVYMSAEDEKYFKDLLYFSFPPYAKDSFFKIHRIQPFEEFEILGVKILLIQQYHGDSQSMGYRIGDFAYSTDVKNMTEEGFQALKGVHTWIMGVTTPVENNKHINVDEALQWIERIQPKQAFFTHMGTRMDYDTLCRKLPLNVRPVFDGMEIDLF